MKTNHPPSPRQQLARERFVHNVERLRVEIRLGTPREHLDVLVELCEWLLDEAGTGKIVSQYRAELGRAKAAVVWRSDVVR